MYYKILVYASAPKDMVMPPKKPTGRFSIYTKEPAKDNRANTSILKQLATHLDVPFKTLRIIKGHYSPQKTIEVREIQTL